MGVSIRYQGVPPRSPLYRRLLKDVPFNTFLAALFPYGAGVFELMASDPHEVDKILAWAIGHARATLEPAAEAQQRAAEFRAELERTGRTYPGIESETASLEKCSTDVEERLTQELAKSRSRAARWVGKLIFGDRLLAPHLRPEGEDILGVVSLPVVREGARVLKGLPPHALFGRDDWEGWCRDNYRRWRRLYLRAARRSEILLVGTA
jgi:hypothetical protein